MVRRILLLVSICISCNIYAYDWFNIADSIAICQKKVSPSWCNYDIDRYMSLRKNQHVIDNYAQQINTGDTIMDHENRPQISYQLQERIILKSRLYQMI